MILNKLKETIYNLELSLLTLEVRSSINKLSLLLTDDFKEFGSSGKVYSKKEVLECLPIDTKIDSSEFCISNFQVQLLAEGIILATYTLNKIYANGKSIMSLRSSLWRESQQDGWQMTFHQGTLI